MPHFHGPLEKVPSFLLGPRQITDWDVPRCTQRSKTEDHVRPALCSPTRHVRSPFHLWSLTRSRGLGSRLSYFSLTDCPTVGKWLCGSSISLAFSKVIFTKSTSWGCCEASLRTQVKHLLISGTLIHAQSCPVNSLLTQSRNSHTQGTPPSIIISAAPETGWGHLAGPRCVLVE